MNKNILKWSKNSVYKKEFTLYNYGNNNYRLILSTKRQKGFEDVSLNYKLHSTEEEIKKAKFLRVKRKIREYALCNDFNYFVTLTFSDKKIRYDLEAVFTFIKQTFKKIKRKHSDFIYLLICEQHKDGAYHFHGLVNEVYNSYINDNGHISSLYFDSLGFHSFLKFDIKDICKVSNYILKYISKDITCNSHGSSYIASRGLRVADVCTYDCTSDKLDYFNDKYKYKNDYVSVYDFNFEELSSYDKLKILGLLKE